MERAGADGAGRTRHLAVINRSARGDVTARIVAPGGLPVSVTVRTIGADEHDLFAHNSTAEPDRVGLSAPREVRLEDGTHTFRAHSITLLTWDRG